MRGSILVTFDEYLDARAGQSYQLSVDGILRDFHFTDINNYYSTFVFTGNTVVLRINRLSYIYKSEVVIKRLDFTNDDEEGDRGIKETIIIPTISFPVGTSLTDYQFTASTINSAYNFHYVIECTTSVCFNASSGFTGGTDPSVTDIDILSNGKIIVSGEYTSYRGTSANRIVQLNNNGTIYSGFSYGSGFTPDTTNEVVELSNGKIVIVGQFTNYNGTSCNRIIGLNADGTVNTGFTIGTGFNTDPGPIERQSDDKVIIGGKFWEYDGTTSPKIIRLNTDGSYDNTFVVGSGFTIGGTFDNINSEVSCLAVQSDGKIVVGGNFDAYSGTSVTRICRLNSDGSLDNTFSTGTGLNGVPVEIKIQSDGKILVGGYFTSYNGTTSNRIVRLNTDGTIDSTFSIGTGFNAEVLAIEFTQDAKILVGGNFTTYSGLTRFYCISLNSDGSINTSIQIINVNNRVDSIAVDSEGDIYLGGLFNLCQTNFVQRFVKLSSDGNIYSCKEPVPTPTPTPTPTPVTPTPTPTMTPTPTPTLTPACACFDVGTGFDVGPGAANITIQPNDNFLIGGQFLNYNGFNQPRLINLNGCGNAITSFTPIFNNVVYGTRVQTDNKIIALGAFNNALGKNLTRLNTDGTKDTTFDAGTAFDVGNIATNLIILSNGKLVASGNIRSYRGTSIGKIVKINSDGSFNSSYGTGANDRVRSVVQLSDNSLLVAGDFTSFNGYSYNRLVKITPGDSVDTSFSIGTGFDSDVFGVAVQPDGKIICVGSFDSYNGTTAYGIIRLNSDGTIDNTFLSNIGSGSNFGITSFLLQSDGKILLNGGFSSFNGTTALNIIRLNSNGTIDGTFTIPTTNGPGFVSMAIDTTGNLYFVGLFTDYNGTSTNGIIRLNSSGNESICP